MQRSLARNLKLYPWYLAFTYEGVSNAVWYLYLFSYKGLSLGEMAWLVLLGDGVIVLAEVPTGWLADKLGRRFSIIVGILLQAASALLFIFGTGFGTFWLAMAVCGLGDTFRSGADQALLYDSCLAASKRERFRPVLASSMFIATLAMVAGQISGGVIATKISWELPFWIEVAMSATGLVAVLMMVEAPRLAKDDSSRKISAGKGRSSQGFWLVAGRLLPVALFASVVEVVPELAHFHLPAELASRLGLTPLHLGFLYAGFELLQGLGNKLAGHRRLSEPLRILPWASAALLICLGLMGTRLWLGVAVYLTARAGIDFLTGLLAPLISEEANRRVASDRRATALSVINAAQRLLPLGLLPLTATLVGVLGYGSMFLLAVLTIAGPLAFSLLWLFRWRNEAIRR